MASTASGPGLLFVNSKITSPDLSPELFTKWYEEVHIPDIFSTSGIKTSFRYFTASSDPATVERPWLALYPIKDVAFLYSDEVRAIPVHSDMLPVESKSLFDVADIETRFYTNVGMSEGRIGSEHPLPSMTAVQCDLPTDLKNSKDTEIVKWYASQYLENSSARTRMYRLAFPEPDGLPEILALHEFAAEKEVETFSLPDSLTGNQASFKLLKGYGNTKHIF